MCRDVFGLVGLVSGRVLRGRILCRDVIDEDWLVSGRGRRGLVSMGTCSAISA